MTIELFREDGYLKSCQGRVTQIFENGFSVNQTVFYPMGGGQPGDIGEAKLADGKVIVIDDCRKDKETGEIVHCAGEGNELLNLDEEIVLELNWDRRLRLMRMHSCMHMLCAVLPFPVTGGAIRDGSARLDFDLPEPPTKEELEDSLNKIIQGNHAMSLSWITDEEMSQNADLVKTMSVAPPTGSGKVRLVKFGDVDLQACGGTHVANSSEIGLIKVESIKNKGKQNRRVTIEFA